MKHSIGIIGLVLGFLALGIAIFQEDLRPAPPKIEYKAVPDSSFKELAIDVSKKLIKEKLLKQEVVPQPKVIAPVEKSFDVVRLSYMLLGFAAMVMGVISWVNKDHVRMAGGAIALGVVALAWQYILIGIAIAVIIYILANFSISID